MTDFSIRGQYEQYGVQAYYAEYGAAYRNPHESIIRKLVQQVVETWALDLTHVLDLACGSGEVTLILRALGCPSIEGIDPFTYEAYWERTHQIAERITFEQIATGAISDRHYSLIVCSFAMHLVAESWLPTLTYQLSQIADSLLILTPHKRPRLKSEWGWQLVNEMSVERVRVRYYTK